MSRAIIVKFHGPTNTKGSRYSARADGEKAIFMPVDYSMSEYQNQEAVAQKLAKRMNLTLERYGVYGNVMIFI